MRARLVGHIELVTIEPIDRAGTHVDALADEPYASIARASTVALPAQVEEVRRNARQPSQSGARLPAEYKLTFLSREVAASGWRPADGDRVVQLADRDGGNPRAVNLYVRGPRFSGKTSHGAELVVLELVNRDSRQPSEGL